MNVFIRADASVEMGTGHIMRCLTLAEKLRDRGATVSFISRNHEGNLNDWIRSVKKFTVYSLPVQLGCQNNKSDSIYKKWLGADVADDVQLTRNILSEAPSTIDWLIIDHYGIDEEWEKKLRPYVGKIMVIDDLANRPHDCDVLLDQNMHSDMEARYETLVSPTCRKFLGPQYALLRQEFINERKKLRKRDGILRRILIFFGGTDPTNETMKTLKAIESLNRNEIRVDVIVGLSNPHKEQVQKKCLSLSHVNYYCQVNNMASFIREADLAIGASGSSTWERCCLGLPALSVCIADNQELIARESEKKGIGIYLGNSNEVDSDKIKREIEKLINSPDILLHMQKKCLSVVNGHGAEFLSNVLFEKKEFSL
jgi:UDP-2,4-diacetamido-2,4,6-trideoxy-beta-L-altropyranose hydrolase